MKGHVAFEDFRRCAEAYCAVVEEIAGSRAMAPSARLAAHLAELLAACHRLPDTEPSDDELPDGPTHDEWGAVFGGLGAAFGARDMYRTVAAAMDAETEPTVGSLADDLADIWRDMRRGLDGLAHGSSWQDVAWEWRFGLRSHWGQHVVEALRVFHNA